MNKAVPYVNKKNGHGIVMAETILCKWCGNIQYQILLGVITWSLCPGDRHAILQNWILPSCISQGKGKRSPIYTDKYDYSYLHKYNSAAPPFTLYTSTHAEQ